MIIIIMGVGQVGVGQVGALAYHGKLDAPARQSFGWNLCNPCWGNNTG